MINSNNTLLNNSTRSFHSIGLTQSAAAVAKEESLLSHENKPLFDKILIANRGEIACRVMRTCQKLGIKTVAVYSEADAKSMHVAMADEAFLIGPAESQKSYLRGEKILEVAKKTGAQAIHPGYGFLSENANFARECENAGIVFIGPPATAIISMGSKSESKKIMEGAKVPVVPGYHGDDQAEDKLLAEAKKIGFPVLIKAVMGGGGKGMRIVAAEKEFIEQLHSAKREALNSFADDRVLVERYIGKPRHVEIQVFADTLGNCVYLFERDCSVQRRHQKIIEEAPAPGLSDEVRRAMGESAVAAAKAVGYVGAGTVEFIMDNTDQKYYFMEMNTRLQVEHPVTEMITGQDLVDWQVRVASGHRLPKLQSELKPNGHSFEARIYAENPDKGFLPGTGKLKYLSPPEESEHVRVETGVRQGDEVSIYYDPMIAKLVVWGEDREIALKKLKNCLDKYHISGVTTNIEFLKRLATNQKFREIDLDTHFIERYRSDLFPERKTSDEIYVLGAISLIMNQQAELEVKSKTTVFSTLSGVHINHHNSKTIVFHDEHDEDVTVPVEITYLFDGNKNKNVFSVKTNDKTFEVKASYSPATNELTTFINGSKYQAASVVSDNEVNLFTRQGTNHKLKPVVVSIGESVAAGKGSLKSPMPGKIVNVNVQVGHEVKQGDTLLEMEAMKMVHKIIAPKDGIVKSMPYKKDDLVEGDAVLVELDDLPSE